LTLRGGQKQIEQKIAKLKEGSGNLNFDFVEDSDNDDKHELLRLKKMLQETINPEAANKR
jgi:hypothetical protein